MEWFPSIVTTGAFAVVLFLLRNIIMTRLANSVKHEFNEKLEKQKSDYRKEEEFYRAKLEAAESQYKELHSLIISGMLSRHELLNKRRIKALELIWEEIYNLAPVKAASVVISTLKYKEALEEASSNPQFRKIFETIGEPVQLDRLKKITAFKSKPFVSELVWSLYTAYEAILMDALIKIHMLQKGINQPNLIDTKRIKTIIEVALPHHKDLLEKYGDAAFHHLLEELEEKLLKEIKNDLNGTASDEDTIERAKKISKAVASLKSEQEAYQPPE